MTVVKLRDRPTLTIVIPVYNEEDNIVKCLQSIARQTAMPDEVLVVDNNSTDDTVALAREFPFVRVVTASQQGIAYAREVGFDAASGRIIGRIDADSRLKPGWVESVKRFYTVSAHAATAVTGGGYFYNVAWPKFAGRLQHRMAFRYNRLLLGHQILWGSNMALPKQMWQEVRADVSMNPAVHEDIDLAIVLHRAGYDIHFRKSMVVGVRMKRVHSDRHKLWSNLMMWPRTLRNRGIKTWPLATAGAVFLYVISVPLRVAEYISVVVFGYPKKIRQLD